jgi:hypothetical protein
MRLLLKILFHNIHYCTVTEVCTIIFLYEEENTKKGANYNLVKK